MLVYQWCLPPLPFFQSHSPYTWTSDVSPRSQRKKTMVPREKSATESAFDSSFFSSDPTRKPRRSSTSFFSLPRLFVASGKGGGAPDSDPARSPTSPLDCKVFSSLGSYYYLSRSPRSPNPHRERIGLGLVDALADEPHHAGVRILSSATSPKHYVISQTPRVGSPLLRPTPPETAPESPVTPLLDPVKKTRKTPPFSTDTDGLSSFFANQNLDLASGFISSLSASDIEQSEDYTCIISRGPNPKTTHIFGDRILETHTGDFSDLVVPNKGGGEEEGGSSSWTVTCCSSEDPMPSFPSENFLRVCYSCKKKLEGKDIYMYRGEKGFCSSGCRSQEILVEEEEMEDPGSFASGGSTSCEEIFLPGMDVANISL